MRVINRAALSAAAVLAVVFASLGSYKEVSDYDIVSGIAIDYDGQSWLVCCEICVPSADNDFGSGSVYVNGKGDTIDSAFEDAQKRSANILYTDCNQLYIIGENAKGRQEVSDYFMQDNINLRAVTVYAQGMAQDVLSKNKDDENSRARSLTMAKKLSRYCSDNHLPSPRVTQYLKGSTKITVSAEQTPYLEANNA